MEIDLKQEIGGFPVGTLRKLLRRREHWQAPEVAEALALDDEGRALQLLLEAMKAGYLETDPPLAAPGQADSSTVFVASDLGSRLAATKALKRLPRVEAEAQLAKIRQGIEGINAATEFVYAIERVFIFGSALGDSETVGDIDLVLELALKPEAGTDIVAANKRRANASGKVLRFLDRLCYGQTEVTRAFKKLSRYISLHEFSEIERLGCAHTLFYERKPKAPSKSEPSQGSSPR